MNTKHAIVGALSTLALILFIVAAATPIATTDGAYMTYWKSCVKILGDMTCSSITKDDFTGCDKRWSLLAAGRAFTILCCLIVGVAAILSVVRIFHNLIFTAKPVLHKVGIVGMLGTGLLFGLLNFAVGFAYYDAKICDTSVKELGYDVGASAPVALIGWLFTIGAFGVEMFYQPEEGGYKSFS